MADESTNFPEQDPLRKRRSQVESEQVHSITYAKKGLSQERLDALKEFLKHAKTDEIAAVRRTYGDMPEVLRMIGLEMVGEAPVEQQQVDIL